MHYRIPPKEEMEVGTSTSPRDPYASGPSQVQHASHQHRPSPQLISSAPTEVQEAWQRRVRQPALLPIPDAHSTEIALLLYPSPLTPPCGSSRAPSTLLSPCLQLQLACPSTYHLILCPTSPRRTNFLLWKDSQPSPYLQTANTWGTSRPWPFPLHNFILAPFAAAAFLPWKLQFSSFQGVDIGEFPSNCFTSFLSASLCNLSHCCISVVLIHFLPSGSLAHKAPLKLWALKCHIQ